MGRSKRVARLLLPILFIIGWTVLAAIAGPYFGRVNEVVNNSPSAFLPASSDSTKVSEHLTDFLGSDSLPGVVVVSKASGLSPTDRQELTSIRDKIADIDGLASEPSPLIPSKDGKAAEVIVPIKTGTDTAAVVSQIRDEISHLSPSLKAHITGPAGLSSDLADAFAGIDGILLGVALAAVFVILLIVYRAVLLPILVLTTSMFALCAALFLNWWLAKGDVILLTGQTQGVLFILVIGAATDYSLLYTSRFREELHRRPDRIGATLATLRGTWEPIVASGGTVIVGLLCLLLSDLGSNTSLGPVGAIGIACAMLAALTLLPALLAVFGRVAYWPRRMVPASAQAGDDRTKRGFYHRIGRTVARRPRALWVASSLFLLVLAVGAFGFKADGVSQSDYVLGASDARDGEAILSDHFPGGSGSPAYVLAPKESLERTAKILASSDGVASVSVSSEESPSGSIALGAKGDLEPVALGNPDRSASGDSGPAARRGSPANSGAKPTVRDGRVLLQATLTDSSDSKNAQNSVERIRREMPRGAYVGGAAATQLDTLTTAIHDRNLIIPVVLVVIALILALLLRSLVAPLLLMAATVLSFAATLGVSALLFNHVFDFPGADPTVLLYGFVFLVALGIDYNIFLMTRVREESKHRGTKAGILTGLAVTGGVITSAGVVLAATFSALAVIPLLFLVQLAFVVAFGVLLDTFLVRTIIVPALSYDIGRAIWWPSRLSGGQR